MFEETVFHTTVDASTGKVISSTVTTETTWAPIVYPFFAVVFIAAVLFWSKRRGRSDRSEPLSQKE